jgi:hypothetical protein
MEHEERATGWDLTRLWRVTTIKSELDQPSDQYARVTELSPRHISHSKAAVRVATSRDMAHYYTQARQGSEKSDW